MRRSINSEHAKTLDTAALRKQFLVEQVFERFGRVIAGLSISFPTMRCGADTKSHYVALLRQSGLAISTRLGYREATAPAHAAIEQG